MKLTKSNLRLLKNLENIGVEFIVFGSDYSGGFHTLPIDKLVKYTKGPKLWREELGAKQAGVSLQQYRIWNSYVQENQCKGITSKGQRCRIVLNLPPPHLFNPDIDCYCKHHSRLG